MQLIKARGGYVHMLYEGGATIYGRGIAYSYPTECGGRIVRVCQKPFPLALTCPKCIAKVRSFLPATTEGGEHGD